MDYSYAILLLGIYIISKQFDRTIQLIIGAVLVVIGLLLLGTINLPR